MTTTEQLVFVISGLLIIAYFIYMFGYPFVWKALKHKKEFDSKFPKKCTCELGLEHCKNQMQVSDQGVMSQPDYAKCPRMIRLILKSGKESHLIVQIHTKRNS